MKAESAERLTVDPFPFPHPSQRLQPLLLRRLPSVLAFLFLLSVVFLSADVPGAAAFLLLSKAGLARFFYSALPDISGNFSPNCTTGLRLLLCVHYNAPV